MLERQVAVTFGFAFRLAGFILFLLPIGDGCFMRSHLSRLKLYRSEAVAESHILQQSLVLSHLDSTWAKAWRLWHSSKAVSIVICFPFFFQFSTSILFHAMQRLGIIRLALRQQVCILLSILLSIF